MAFLGFDHMVDEHCQHRCSAIEAPAKMPEQSGIVALRSGWIVEAMVPTRHAMKPSQIVFAASIEDADAAVDAVRLAIGGLHCEVEAKIRLSPRALAQLAVRPGEVRSL